MLLNVCNEIIIVEPNFDATERRFTETIHEILEMRTAAPQQLSRFEIHTKRSQTFRADIQRAHFERAFASVLPEQTKLKGFFWEPKQGGEKLHPRFLLTELGGIQFDYGLDEGDGAKDTTIVSALDHALYEQLRQDYSATGTAFEIRPDSILEISSTNKRRRSL